jgi:hypothetical protein
VRKMSIGSELCRKTNSHALKHFKIFGRHRSRRKGKEELSGHSALIASPQFLVAVRVGLPVPFVCNETHELGAELVGSYRYQVHLLHWLESNVYGVFLSDKRSTYRSIYKG